LGGQSRVFYNIKGAGAIPSKSKTLYLKKEVAGHRDGGSREIGSNITNLTSRKKRRGEQFDKTSRRRGGGMR